MKKIKMKKINVAILGAMMSIASASSFAQNNNVSKDASLVTSNNQEVTVKRIIVEGSLNQVGTPSSNPAHKKELKGFANELPLVTVMKQITPNGWIVKKSDSSEDKLDVQKLVSWQGGKNWIETLEQIAKAYNLNIVVNWDDSVITLSNATKVITLEKSKKVSIFELEGTQSAKVSDVVMGASEQVAAPVAAPIEVAKNVEPVVAVAPTPVQNFEVQTPAVQSNWELSSSKSLRDNVAAWAEKSGYRLVWTGEDYPVVDTRILAGEFDSENGPIRQLSVDYGPDSRAQNPLSFQFYQNRTLVVENWMFEQNGYPQFNKKQ